MSSDFIRDWNMKNIRTERAQTLKLIELFKIEQWLNLDRNEGDLKKKF